MVVTEHPEFASVQVERLFKCVQDTALPGPRIVGIVILHPEGGGVFLPVRWAIYTTALVLEHEPVPGLGNTVVFPFVVVGWGAVVLIPHQHLLQEEVGCEKVSLCGCCDTRCHFETIHYEHHNEVRQEHFPVGLHDSYNGENRQAEEADAHKHAYPSCPKDVIVVGGFKQRVETVLVRYKEDALCS